MNEGAVNLLADPERPGWGWVRGAGDGGVEVNTHALESAKGGGGGRGPCYGFGFCIRSVSYLHAVRRRAASYRRLDGFCHQRPRGRALSSPPHPLDATGGYVKMIIILFGLSVLMRG